MSAPLDAQIRTLEDAHAVSGNARPIGVRTVSAVVYNDQGQLLMGLRNDSKKWTLSGGHLDPGEAPAHGAIRELYEEANIQAEDMQFLGDAQVGKPDGKYVNISVFKVKANGTPSGVNDPDQECSIWRWVDLVDGLPPDIANNLQHKENVSLRMVGLQRGPIFDDSQDPLKVSATDLLENDVVNKSLYDHPSYIKAVAVKNRIESLAAAGPKPSVWGHRNHAGHVVVSQDPSKPTQWRVTHFTPEGEPTGHLEAPNHLSALWEAHKSGANLMADPVLNKAELEKAHPGPVFPKLGVTDRNKHAVPIVTTPRQAEIVHRAIINNALQANMVGQDTTSPLKTQDTPPKGQISNEGWDEVSSNSKLKGQFRENSVVGLNRSKSLNGVASVIGNPIGYSKGHELRADGAPLDIKPTVATQLHENLHQMFNQVQKKYGMEGRKNLAANMMNELKETNPDGWIALKNMVGTTHPEYSIKNPNRPPQADEEHLTHLLNYVNDPHHRQAFHRSVKLSEGQARQYQNWMKSAYYTINKIANKAPATMVLHPNDYSRIGKSEDGVIYLGMDLQKSLKGKLLGTMLGVTALVPSAHAQDVSNLYSWTKRGLNKEILPIAHLESSDGKNINHAPNSHGEFYTAFGALGFKPVTAYDTYSKSPRLQKSYPGLHSQSEFVNEFKQNPQFYNAIANFHWTNLKKALSNDKYRTAYGWRWGAGAAMNAQDEDVFNDPYVEAYAKLSNPAMIAMKKEQDKREFEELAKTIPLSSIKAGPKLPSGEHDYSHLLSPEHRAAGYGLTVSHSPTSVGHSVAATVYHNGEDVGVLGGNLGHNKGLEVYTSDLGDEHRGKGLGQGMYSALYAHSKNQLGATHVVGTAHSSLASRVHQKLSAAHGLNYQPQPNFGPGTKYLTQEHWAAKAPQPYDEKFSSYRYNI